MLRLSLVAAAAVGITGFGPAARAESMMDQMIFSKCSSAMNADFAKAGQTPPDGLVQKTCDCVVKKISETHNIEVSKQLCTQKLTQGS
jgi:hypothetical protein